MMRRAIVLILLAPACVLAQDKGGHARVTDVSAPQAQYQVISSEQIGRIYSQDQAIADIKERLSVIEQSIKDIRADVKTLSETNTIAQFLISCIKYLVPGILIAAFTVWFSKRQPPPKKPAKARTI